MTGEEGSDKATFVDVAAGAWYSYQTTIVGMVTFVGSNHLASPRMFLSNKLNTWLGIEFELGNPCLGLGGDHDTNNADILL